jgi:pimeloyl-ACP methyl ester carboxylesterase
LADRAILTSVVTTADGRSLTVHEGGDPDGVPMLVHMGTPGSSLLYQPHVRDAEERGVRLFSYSRPGYAGSTRVPGRTVADCAADVVAVCDALEVGRFCAWGISGGGPHVLATAALLPDRVAAIVAIASVAPFDAEGLDYTAGMGELNVETFEAIAAGDDAHWAQLERDHADVLEATPEGLVEAWRSLLGPADLAVLTDSFAAFMVDNTRLGVAESADGWFDDEVAVVEPWGFELSSIEVPVLYWHGRQDKFVPFAHGEWLAARIPGVEARLTDDDGHLTVFETGYGQLQDWLQARFND